MPDAEFNILVKKRPQETLLSKQATSHMSDEQFDYCVKVSPLTVILTGEHVHTRLTQSQIDLCLKREPRMVLTRGPFIPLLTDIQLDDCLKAGFDPDTYEEKMEYTGISYHAINRLTPYQKSWLEKQNHE
jgi:hypothetical protein